MSEAPKKIWADKNALWWMGKGKERVQYIRADIVEDMRKALLDILNEFGPHPCADSARTALKRLEE